MNVKNCHACGPYSRNKYKHCTLITQRLTITAEQHSVKLQSIWPRYVGLESRSRMFSFLITALEPGFEDKINLSFSYNTNIPFRYQDHHTSRGINEREPSENSTLLLM